MLPESSTKPIPSVRDRVKFKHCDQDGSVCTGIVTSRLFDYVSYEKTTTDAVTLTISDVEKSIPE
jgi:hypothetical protein